MGSLILPYKQKAYKLLHQGSLALAQVESNGIRMDVEYLNDEIERQTLKIGCLEQDLKHDQVAKVWRRMYGKTMNFGSGDQLGKVLFEGLDYKAPAYTKSGKYKVNETTLASLDIPFVKKYVEVKKLKHVVNTYLKGIRREIVGGLLHPFFNLHTAITYRSSSSNPNFQNLPIRDPILGKMVRSAFIARPGRHIIELDYRGIEVSFAACYHKDPNMLEYLTDSSKDMHRDCSQECYILPPGDMLNPVDDKDKKRISTIRYCGKNKFVFPEFYGDWYIDCAKALWEAIGEFNLCLRDGTPLKDHLAKKGIHELGDCDPDMSPRSGTFEKHIKDVEYSFWNDRFPIYNQWKKDWVKQVNRDGYFLTKTGFICQGVMKKNEMINYPVQGSAFHGLLQGLIWNGNTIEKRSMDSLIIGQIHDSIVGDVPAGEVEEYLHLSNRNMTKRLRKVWPWIITPLEIEAEMTPLDGCWADKKEVTIS